MNKAVRRLVFARANGRCECGCLRFITEETGRLDHFWGRAKAEETVETCWALSVACDEAKTANRPTSMHWNLKFLIHCAIHGYERSETRAAVRDAALRARGFSE